MNFMSTGRGRGGREILVINICMMRLMLILCYNHVEDTLYIYHIYTTIDYGDLVDKSKG